MSTFLKWEDPSRGQRGLSQDPALKKARVKLIITPWKQTPDRAGPFSFFPALLGQFAPLLASPSLPALICRGTGSGFGGWHRGSC